jgi:hypothetical protein
MPRSETIIKQLHIHIEELEFKIVSQQREILKLQELINLMENQDKNPLNMD